MKLYPRRGSMVFMVVVLLFVSRMAAAVVPGMPENFYQVSPDLYRSSQPDAEQMKALEALGIKTILSLRQWNKDDGPAKGTQLQLRRVRINAAVIGDGVVVDALREIRFAQKPVLVHCWHGSDRTGLIVAMYRLVFERADKADVLAELRSPAHGYHESFYGGIANYISSVNVESIRQRVYQ